jgi:hypothetical protein
MRSGNNSLAGATSEQFAASRILDSIRHNHASGANYETGLSPAIRLAWSSAIYRAMSRVE